MKQKDIIAELKAIKAKAAKLIEHYDGGDAEAETDETEEGAESEAEDSEDESEEEGETEVNLPASEDEINELDKKDVLAQCKQIGIDTEGKKQSELKELLITVLKLVTKKGKGIEKEQADALADAIGVKKSKKLSGTIEALAEYFSGGDDEEAEDSEDDSEESEDSDEESEESDDDEESEDEDKEEESDEDEESEDSDEDEDKEESDEDESEESEDEEESEESEDEEEGEEVDAAAVAAEAKLPKEKVMEIRLKAYNKAAGKKAIDVKKAGGTKKAYRKLLENLVTSEGEIADWGTPYIHDGEHYCAGLPLKEKKVKGHKQCGQCVVTGKVYSIDDENNYEEVEA